MKSGIHNLSADKYHADPCESPSLSCGIAKILLAQSPAHAWVAHPRLNPDYQDEQRKDFDLGTAAHAMLLEGSDIVTVCDFSDWRTKAAQEARELARMEGKIPLLPSQYADVKAMAEIAKQSALDAGFNMSNGKPEQTVIWQEEGIWLRARPDWLSDDHDKIIDFKTTALSSPAAWMRAIPGNGYDVQDAFYRRGGEAVTGIAPEFVFMVQEVSAPYAVYFVELPASYRAIGEQKVETAIHKWRECMKSGKWPAYAQQIMQPEPPAWLMAEAEELQAERENSVQMGDFDRTFAGVSREAFMFGKVPEKGSFFAGGKK